MTMTTEERLETMRKISDMYEIGYKNGKTDVYAVIMLILTLTICVVIGTGIIVL